MADVCSRCLYDTGHPFGLTITQGVCSGCLTHEEKNLLDWSQREALLRAMLSRKTKRARKRFYDVVVPVQGDAEDYFVVGKVLKLGLNPLIVAVNDYFRNDIGWHNLHQLITHFDLDSMIFNPNLAEYKELVRTSLRKHGHIMWPHIALHTAFPVHVAKDRRIPLIIWGQHQAIEQVGKFSHTDEVEMTRWSRQEHDLFGFDIIDMIGNGAQIDTRHLNYYLYPDIQNLARQDVTGIYLSNYFRWDPYCQNSEMTVFGFRPQYTTSSFDTCERAGSSVYYQFHDLLKFQRTGYRKIRDHLVREIRHGRLSREDAVALEQFYGARSVDVDPFFDWLSMSTTGKAWFKMHVLGDMKYLLEDNEVPSSPMPLPERMQKYHHFGEIPVNNFVAFGKGISH